MVASGDWSLLWWTILSNVPQCHWNGWANLCCLPLWTGIKPVHAQWSDVKQGSLHFTPMTNEINNIKVNNSDIKVGCQGPYIIYPYIQDIDEKESFNITVVKGEKVLHSMHFSTENRTTWKHMILDLDKNDHISVFVSCPSTCPFVGQFCLALNFLLGSACVQWLKQTWSGSATQRCEEEEDEKGPLENKETLPWLAEQEWTPQWYFIMKMFAQVCTLLFRLVVPLDMPIKRRPCWKYWTYLSVSFLWYTVCCTG